MKQYVDLAIERAIGVAWNSETDPTSSDLILDNLQRSHSCFFNL